MIGILLNMIFEIVFVATVGYIGKKRKILSNVDEKSMNNVCMRIVFLFTILMSSQKEFSVSGAEAIGITAIMGILYFLLGIPLSMFFAKKLGLSDGKKRIFVASSIFFQITFVGLPVAQRLLGDEGVLCVVMFNAISSVVCYTWGYAYVGSAGKVKLKDIFTNAISLCSIASIIIYFLQIKIPGPLANAFNSISAANFPLSMLVIGCMLADADLRDILRIKEIYWVTGIRMIIFPGIVYGIMRMIGIGGTALQACTIIAGLPVGAVTCAMAALYDVEKEYAVEIMMQSLFAMLIILPVWIYTIQM